MQYSTKRSLVVLSVFLMLASAQQAWCSGLNEKKFAKDASNSIAPFLVVTELSLATDGKSAKPEMVQGAKALLATTVITQALKYTVREKRPNSESLSSFPSGHTSSAFAMATVVADYKPKYKWLAYGAASVIGWSRVEVGAHRWHDVLAGAAIGYVTAKHFTNQHFSVSPNGTVGYSWKW